MGETTTTISHKTKKALKLLCIKYNFTQDQAISALLKLEKQFKPELENK